MEDLFVVGSLVSLVIGAAALIYALLLLLLPICVVIIQSHTSTIANRSKRMTAMLEQLIALQIEQAELQRAILENSPQAIQKNPPLRPSAPAAAPEYDSAESYQKQVIKRWAPPHDLDIGDDVYDLIHQCRKDGFSVEQTVDNLREVCEFEDA